MMIATIGRWVGSGRVSGISGLCFQSKVFYDMAIYFVSLVAHGGPRPSYYVIAVTLAYLGGVKKWGTNTYEKSPLRHDFHGVEIQIRPSTQRGAQSSSSGCKNAEYNWQGDNFLSFNVQGCRRGCSYAESPEYSLKN